MITRFAPAPTGFLHLGHIVNALHVWGAARECGGRVLLRIEDHDRQRSRRQYEDALVEDLRWLGFAWDGPPVRQSEREAVYRDALAKLVARGLVYGCMCSRATLGGSGGRDPEAPLGPAGAEAPALHPIAGGRGLQSPLGQAPELFYPGTCRDKGIALTDGVGWRLRIEPGVERFDDVIRGAQEQDPSTQCGDLLLRDRLGNWTYQFAVTVDDHDQSITDVIRGIDLLASTGRQIRLARLLGRAEPPRFWHHPLVMKSATEKLSKSDGDSGVRDLRAAGWSPDRVLDWARSCAGGRHPVARQG